MVVVGAVVVGAAARKGRGGVEGLGLGVVSDAGLTTAATLTESSAIPSRPSRIQRDVGVDIVAAIVVPPCKTGCRRRCGASASSLVVVSARAVETMSDLPRDPRPSLSPGQRRWSVNKRSHVTTFVDKHVVSGHSGPCTKSAYKGLAPAMHLYPEALPSGFSYVDICI